ncbi:MAG: hypothetical protein NT062_03820 [Proteobacteria bacterium]|nr:hypothetical protein [Pseudomonadota bacterium]
MLVFLLVGHVRVALARPDGPLVGTWIYDNAGTSIALVLAGDGNGALNGVPFTWKASGTTLTLTIGGQSMSYQAVVQGDTLQLSGGDLAAPATMTRKKAPAAPPPSNPATGSIVGTWTYSNGQINVTLVLDASGAGTLNGVAFTWTYAAPTLTVTADGKSTTYQAVLTKPTQLDVAGGDLAAPISLQRPSPGSAGAPGATKTIVGTWEVTSGTTRYVLVLAANHSGTFNGGALTWTYAGTTLALTVGGKTVGYQAVLRGDSLDVSGGDLPGPATLTRQGSGGGAMPTDPTGLAGLWAVTESSVSGSVAMIYTQYVTLYPDGTVGYQKTEGGATSTQVTANRERFRSWHLGGPVLGNAGRWEAGNGTIVVRWRFWNNLVSRGQVDPARGLFSLTGMGVLDEGATLTFKRL